MRRTSGLSRAASSMPRQLFSVSPTFYNPVSLRRTGHSPARIRASPSTTSTRMGKGSVFGHRQFRSKG